VWVGLRLDLAERCVLCQRELCMRTMRSYIRAFSSVLVISSVRKLDCVYVVPSSSEAFLFSRGLEVLRRRMLV